MHQTTTSDETKQGFPAILNISEHGPINIRGPTAPNLRLTSLHPSSPRQTKKYKDWTHTFGLGQLTADVHCKHCSKQTCINHARPQSDISVSFACFRSKNITHAKRFLSSNSQSCWFSKLLASLRNEKMFSKYGVQTTQQKPVSPQRFSPVQEHVWI